MSEPIDDQLPHAPRGMIDRGLAGFRQRRVLMLQGPIGPFFSRLAGDLRAAGATVFKVNFNGGDRLFGRSVAFEQAIDYRGTMAAWPAAFEALIAAHRIDTVLLFGDCRPVHVPAIAIAKRLAVEIGVFEEGYLRPDFITIERDGVNNHSTLPKDPDFYRRAEVTPAPPTAALGSTFGRAALWGALYYCAASARHWHFPWHQYHRALGWREARFWARSTWRKLKYRIGERQVEQRFIGPTPTRFFLVALQTSGDAQVRVHSRFETVERFIEFVIRDFAAHAPADVELAIKHHPLDRGFSDHRALIDRLTAELGVADRCHYLHDQHLPTLLRRALGVVTINSTVGLSAVGEGVPVIVCGEAIYDIEGLVYKGPLARFWTEAPDHRPDFALWQAFRNVLVTTTQFNGSFYKRHPDACFLSGVFWDKRMPTTADSERIPHGRPLRPIPEARSLAWQPFIASRGDRAAVGNGEVSPSRWLPFWRILPARRLAADLGDDGDSSRVSARSGAERDDCSGDRQDRPAAELASGGFNASVGDRAGRETVDGDELDAARPAWAGREPLSLQEQAFEGAETAPPGDPAGCQEGDATTRRGNGEPSLG